ncbi:unnamed protein product [Blepharisma stoltei]|uniref:TFIIS N-terminal domain-containing protein n=1 Tax=Blepharisma stoltei TaxID=1481888 RepID=A0AAU9JTW8_9CILI|nr:unnamed protein product [Blepharisma stoltei]
MIRSNSFTELQNKLTDISGPDGGLQDPRLVSQFVQLMESASSTEEKSILIQSLLETKENSKAVYNRFFSVGGIETLGKWINELVQSSNSEEISVLHRILSCLNKIVVNLDILERTKIYKAVKSICKHSDINLQTKAGALRKKWKEMKQPIEAKPNPIPSDVVAELPAKHPREETLEETEIMENKNDNDEDYSLKRHVRYVLYNKELKLIIIDLMKTA